jgi:hypothetical protein
MEADLVSKLTALDQRYQSDAIKACLARMWIEITPQRLGLGLEANGSAQVWARSAGDPFDWAYQHEELHWIKQCLFADNDATHSCPEWRLIRVPR